MTARGEGAAEPPRRIRRTQGLANDERILDAAIEVLAEVGADALTLRGVAARAGFTYGALYGRYGNAHDLLADLWERRLEAELERLVAIAADRSRDDPCVELCRTTPARRALIETMIVSGRVDDLADVVPDGARAVLAAAGRLPLDPDDRATTGTLARLALGLGAIAHEPLEGEFRSSAALVAPWLRRDDPWTGPAPAPTPPAAITFVDPRDRDDRDGPLLDATLRVIARSGFAGATLRRIGRATGRTSRVVYHAYGSHQGLLAELIRRVTQRNRDVSGVPGTYTDPSAFAARVAGLVGPEGRTRRRLLLEFNLGAVHDPASGPLVAAADATAYAARADRFARAGTPEHASLVVLWRALRNLQFGLALLAETAGGLERGDWRAGAGTLMRGGLADAGVAEGS